MKEQIKEQIIETNFYLTQALIKGNVEDIEKFRAQLNNLVDSYKNELNK